MMRNSVDTQTDEFKKPEISPPKRLKKKRRGRFPHITLKRNYEGMHDMKNSRSRTHLPDTRSVEKNRYNDTLPDIDQANKNCTCYAMKHPYMKCSHCRRN